MQITLDPQHLERQQAFRSFVRQEIAPYAERCDREARLPESLIPALARERLLGASLPPDWGGLGLDMLSYGLLHEEVGRVFSSAAAIVTVHDMAAHAIARWGTPSQKAAWLPRLAAGTTLAAFGVTEAGAGSDVRSVETSAERRGSVFILNGGKKWITGAQLAGLFIVLAKCGDKPTTFLVERDQPGLTVEPIQGMLGLRAAMLGRLEFTNCEIPAENLIGRAGFGIESVVQTALDLGRYNVGWGCLGVSQACLDLAVAYADERIQFGVPLSKHQLIAEMITDMICRVESSRLLCWRAAYLRDSNDPQAMSHTLISKYVASRNAMRVAADALQIHGANGCSEERALERYFRDAKVMEIIEGSNQIQQLLIARFVRRDMVRQARARPAALAAVGD